MESREATRGAGCLLVTTRTISSVGAGTQREIGGLEPSVDFVERGAYLVAAVVRADLDDRDGAAGQHGAPHFVDRQVAASERQVVDQRGDLEIVDVPDVDGQARQQRIAVSSLRPWCTYVANVTAPSQIMAGERRATPSAN